MENDRNSNGTPYPFIRPAGRCRTAPSDVDSAYDSPVGFRRLYTLGLPAGSRRNAFLSLLAGLPRNTVNRAEAHDYLVVAGKWLDIPVNKINGTATMSSTKASTAQLHGFPKFKV